MNDDVKSLPNGDFYVVRNDKPKETPMPQPKPPPAPEPINKRKLFQ